jgi:hypothetical protein
MWGVAGDGGVWRRRRAERRATERIARRTGGRISPRQRIGIALILIACVVAALVLLALIVTGALRLWLMALPLALFVLGVLLTLGGRRWRRPRRAP